MGRLMRFWIWILLSFASCNGWAAKQGNILATQDTLTLYLGYLTKIRCEGRLLVSAVGNEALVRLEPLPKELGCGVLLKPRSPSGRTNLFLETTTGTIARVVEISREARPSTFEVLLKTEVNP